MKIPTHDKIRTSLFLLPLVLLTGCLSESVPSPTESSGTGGLALRIQGAAAAARSMAAEPGGMLVAQVRIPGRLWTDSVSWTGSGASFSFPSLPTGGSYSVKVFVRDIEGRTTHADSVSPVPVLSGTTTPVELSLRAVLGRIVVASPAVPTAIESLSIAWSGRLASRRSSFPRGSGGRTTLRLDSLPVGDVGRLSLRAWNAAKDTLYLVDTTLSIDAQSDLSLSLRWKDATGSISVQGIVVAGGDLQATALFPGQDSADGSLRFDAFSDSGSADWIRISNPGTARVSGSISVVHGSESWNVAIDLAPGARTVLTRLACTDSSPALHALLSATRPVCGVPLSVSWSSLPAVWEMRSPSGSLADRVMVEDGKDGWPDLNASTARTLRRRAGASSMAGRSWCSVGSDDPDGSCP